MKTLVRLPNWVGDTILALPALTGLSRQQGCHFSYAGTALPIALTGFLHHQSEFHLLRRGQGAGLGPWEEIGAYRSQRFDRALLLTPSFSAALRIWSAGITARVGWAEQGRGWLLNTPVRRRKRGLIHLVDEFNELAALCGAQWFPPAPYLPTHEGAAAAAETFLSSRFGRPTDRPLIVLCPGANYGSAKQWPVAHFQRLREMLSEHGYGGLLVGAPGEKSLCQQIIGDQQETWINAAGAGDILFAGELIRRAAAAVCNDTGTMHLTAAVGTPQIAIFGSTDPGWTGPVAANATVLREKLNCAPCFCKQCPIASPAPCLAAVTPEQVFTALLARLKSDPITGAPAIFLDRDGTLCELVPYLHDPRQVKLVPGAADAIAKARLAGYKIVVITNQSGVARGYFDHAAVRGVHQALNDCLSAAGAAVDRFYYCPHHPEFTEHCDCRKPQPGLLRQAAREMRLDLNRSVMIGDTAGDLQAGEAAGTASILVRTGYGGKQLGPLPPASQTVDNLVAAIEQAVSS